MIKYNASKVQKSLVMAIRLKRIIALICLLLGFQTVSAMQLITTDLNYLGSFRVTESSSDDGRTGFSSGNFVVSPDTNSFFLAGNSYLSIAEYPIPELVKSFDIGDLNFTGEPIQQFTKMDDRITHTTPVNDVRSVGPLSLVNGKLFVSVYDPYDASSTKDVDNMIRINDPFNLAESTVTGYFGYDQKMKVSGWLTPIPPEHQSLLGGDYIVGAARMASITGRWSMGPSAAAINKADLLSVEAGEILTTAPMQIYDYDNALGDYLKVEDGHGGWSWNYSGGHFFDDPDCPSWKADGQDLGGTNYNWKPECVLSNDIWGELSNAHYGIIVPGTDTYMTFGRISGNRKGNAYKIYSINDETPGQSSGEWPFDFFDWDKLIWMFDVNDMADGQNGITPINKVQPYNYGPVVYPTFEKPKGEVHHRVSYDITNNKLYVFQGRSDTSQAFEAQHVVAVYELIFDRPNPPTNIPSSLSLTWDAPTLRVDGTSLPSSEIAGYEIKSVCGPNEYKGIVKKVTTTSTSYTLPNVYATCKNYVAVYDTDGKYSEYVWNGVEPTSRDFQPSAGGIR